MFKLTKIKNAPLNVPVMEYFVAGADMESGTLCVLTNGSLVKAGATAKPTFVTMADAVNGNKVAVGRITPAMEFETTFTAVPDTLYEGSKVTTSAGVEVTATTTSGVATIVDKLGAVNIGDKVIVSFE